VANGELNAAAIDEPTFAGELQTHGLPELDLLIRTSGEVRLSNFLLWQAAYAELMFLDTLWPDFNAQVFADALDRYAARERRFGGR
jgi:undecaprenyl diphosphate synthase